MSAAKIQSFVEQVENRDGFAPPEIVQIIHDNKDNVQDKVDKIAAAVSEKNYSSLYMKRDIIYFKILNLLLYFNRLLEW